LEVPAATLKGTSGVATPARNSMPLLRHNRPDERRASRDNKIVSNL
jgi:hypothetical protein